MDGELVPAAAATVPIMSLTLHYGAGAFEGIRSYDGALGPAVFRLQEHLQRLVASAAMLHVVVPYSVEQLAQACTAVLAANQLRAGYLRPIVLIDDGRRGLGAMNNRTRVGIITWPWGTYLGEEGVKHGIRAQISATARMSARSFLPKGKINGQYVNSVIAKRGALLAGYEEAILLDEAGNVAEATGENLFAIVAGTLLTPPLSQPILAGITRDSVLTLARDMGLRVDERSFARDTLYVADEVFLCGTAAEITPVREIDGHRIGNGARGPITERLQVRYRDAVQGKLDQHRAWLTPYRC